MHASNNEPVIVCTRSAGTRAPLAELMVLWALLSPAWCLQNIRSRVEIPRSVPGFVTKQLLVMNYVEGIQITRLGAQSRARALSAVQKRLAKRRVFSRIAEAYGRMMLLEGLFNADGHPGNILVMPGAIHLSSSQRMRLRWSLQTRQRMESKSSSVSSGGIGHSDAAEIPSKRPGEPVCSTCSCHSIHPWLQRACQIMQILLRCLVRAIIHAAWPCPVLPLLHVLAELSSIAMSLP